MNRVLTIFLLLIYSASAFGITVNYHYCGNQLTHSTVVNFGSEGGCKCNPEEMPAGCCKDKLICVKGDTHEASQLSAVALPGSLVVEVPAVYEVREIYATVTPVNPISWRGVKPIHVRPLFLLNSVFRI